MTLRPNKQRSKNAIIMIWLVMVFYIFATVLQVLETIYYHDIDIYLSEDIGDVDYYTFSLLYLFFSFGYTIVYIISAVTFIQWFRRAYFNLHQKIGSLSYTEGWASGGWFIPIMNLFVPYRIMKELYLRTDDLLNENEGESVSYSRPDLSMVKIWWTLWIITGIIEGVSFRIYRFDETDIASTYLDVVACVLTIPLAIVTVNVIRKYSEYESELMKIDFEDNTFSEENSNNLLDIDENSL